MRKLREQILFRSVTGKLKGFKTLPQPDPRDPGDNSPAMICRMIFDELCVLANGEIVCSCGDPAGLRVYGNVFRDRIKNIYNSKMYREMRRWQLVSKSNSWCPVIGTNCGGRISRAAQVDNETGRSVKILQLEPTSYCNLRCPACPVNNFRVDINYRDNRESILSKKMMIAVVNQLPDLEKILFYNFGEPFLHPEAIQFLREIRRHRPGVIIHTNTNGIPLTMSQIEAIASEVLLDQVLFSVDGARQESYAHYRRHGKLIKALKNLEALVRATERYGTNDKIEILWQYILFEWNDTDEEIAEVKMLSHKMGVPIKWVVSHTEGASSRFKQGSKELAALISKEREYNSLTCELKMSELRKNNGVVYGRYRAQLVPSVSKISVPAGSRIVFLLQVENLSKKAWQEESEDAFRLGVLLRTAKGSTLKELPGLPLPHSASLPGGVGMTFIDLNTPNEPGSYQLLVDVVEEHVCWFHERGSQPLIINLEANKRKKREWDWISIVENANKVFFDETSDYNFCCEWAEKLQSGVSINDFLTSLNRDGRETYTSKDQKFSIFWKSIQSLI